jgi:hypothetical protein
MNNKIKLTIGILMILIGAVIFLSLIIRFFNQGYFGGQPRIFYLINLEMNDWFGSIIYSLLFSLAGLFLLIKKVDNSVFVCQFSAIGVLIERFWFIFSKLGNATRTAFIEPMLILFLCILYLILIQQNLNYKEYGKKIGLMMLINLVLISIGKFILPN